MDSSIVHCLDFIRSSTLESTALSVPTLTRTLTLTLTLTLTQAASSLKMTKACPVLRSGARVSALSAISSSRISCCSFLSSCSRTHSTLLS